MKIEHLKNQFRSFTLSSGKSLYLYPMAKDIEISEQDFFLSKKLQRYTKDEKAIAVISDSDNPSQENSEPEVKQVSLEQKAKKSKRKQKALEE